MAGALYHALVFMHLVAALVWLGGMFFLALVGAPVLRSVEPAEVRSRLFHDLGVRFRAVGWGAIGVLLFTGFSILHLRGMLAWTTLSDPAWWGTPLGTALAWKLLAVAAMLAMSAWHDFVAGPRAGRRTLSPEKRDRARRRSAVMARANATMGLLLLYWAMRLARGG
jgi:copper resistance protein D